MKVIRNIHKVNADKHPIHSETYLANRIGFWGIVQSQNSLNNTVTVISDTGFVYENVMVKSDEWVTLDKDYVPSTRNLPPVKSRVFVLTPTYTAVGAVVLCSGFSRGDDNIRTLWAQNQNEVEDKNNSRETLTQGGWDITEEYKNGNYSVKSNDGNIQFNVNTTKDDNKSQPKEVSVTAWDNVIIINEDGISIKDKNDNKIEATDKGITVTDKNSNKIEATSSGIKITDKNNNVYESKSGEFDITVGGSKIAVTNTSVKINNHLEVSV